MSGITPCLWFDGNAEEAAEFYSSLFPNSQIDAIHRAPSDHPSGKAGDVLMVEFRLLGQPFTGLNGGPQFQFNEAISFQIPVETQAEADRFADALSAVPEAEQCGWEKDRFGVSWQIATPVWQAANNIPSGIWWHHLERIFLVIDDLGCHDLLAG